MNKNGPAELLRVDDASNTREQPSTSLNFAGLEVVCALSGRDAVRDAELHATDLADGVAATCKLRASDKHVPILSLTAKNDAPYEITGLAYNFNGDASIVESYISYLRRTVDLDADSSAQIRTNGGMGYLPRKQKSADLG